MRAEHHPGPAQAGFWPVTHSGAWSLRLMALAALAMVLSMVAVAAGQRGGDTLGDNWVLSSLGLVMAARPSGRSSQACTPSAANTNGLSRS